MSQKDFGLDFSVALTIQFIRKHMCKYSYYGTIRTKHAFWPRRPGLNTTRRVEARTRDPILDVATRRAETAVCGFISVVFEGTRGAATAVYCLLRRFTVHVIIPALKFFLLPTPKHDAGPSNTQETRKDDD